MVYRFYCIVLYHFQTQHHVIYIWYACLFYSRTMLHSCWDSDSCRQIFQYPDLFSRPHDLYRKSAEWVSIANYYTFMRKHVFLICDAVRHCFQALITFGESIIWASSQKKLSSEVFEKHRRRPASASAQSDQRLSYFAFWKVSCVNLVQVKFQFSRCLCS